MSQCYSIELRVRFTYEPKARLILLDRINKGEEEHTRYNTDDYDLLTTDGLIKVFITDRNFTKELMPDGFTIYTTEFDASYGWEGVMQDMFFDLAPVLVDGSYIDIYPDSHPYRYIANGGKAILDTSKNV